MLLAMRILFVVCVVAAIGVSLTRRLPRFARRLLLGVSLLGAIGSLLFYSVISSHHKQQAAQKAQGRPATSVRSLDGVQVDRPTSPASGKLADYTVIANPAAGLTVYTPEKDAAKLVQLNDELWSKYGQGKDPFRIDYFDDKTIAKDYFTAVTKPGLTEAEQKKLTSHYIAFMIYDSAFKRKELDRQGVPIETLKKY